MKPFNVFLYDLSIIPLSQNPNPHHARIERFETQQEAIDFAKSERKRWGRATVSGPDGEIVNSQGNDMYIGSERTRLSPNE